MPDLGKHADPRRDFAAGPGHPVSCTCSECSTTWGTITCPRCRAWIPTLLPSVRAWTQQASMVGSIDKALGADVLAVPCIVGSEVGFACPSCGEAPEA